MLIIVETYKSQMFLNNFYVNLYTKYVVSLILTVRRK